MKKKIQSKMEEEMRYHIQMWKQGKQSQQEYCHENNLAYHKFIYWHSKFRRKLNPIEQAFMLIQLEQPDHSSSLELEIAYPNGVRLRVPSGNVQFTIGQLIRLI